MFWPWGLGETSRNRKIRFLRLLSIGPRFPKNPHLFSCLSYIGDIRFSVIHKQDKSHMSSRFCPDDGAPTGSPFLNESCIELFSAKPSSREATKDLSSRVRQFSEVTAKPAVCSRKSKTSRILRARFDRRLVSETLKKGDRMPKWLNISCAVSTHFERIQFGYRRHCIIFNKSSHILTMRNNCIQTGQKSLIDQNTSMNRSHTHPIAHSVSIHAKSGYNENRTDVPSKPGTTCPDHSRQKMSTQT